MREVKRINEIPFHRASVFVCVCSRIEKERDRYKEKQKEKEKDRWRETRKYIKKVMDCVCERYTDSDRA